MFTLNCKGRLLALDKPVVMGILNITPDSFYSASRYQQMDVLLKKAEEMLADGVSILDIGGQSTRPGSEPVSSSEELSRVVEPIKKLKQNFPQAILSIDTYYAEVAREAIGAGCSIVNDISAGSLDEKIIRVVAELKVPYVLMHMKGKPQTMQLEANYTDVTKEVLDFFIRKIPVLREAGIKDIIVDPGFGFGKTASQNFELLRNLRVFEMLELPLLAGLSRKSTITKTLGITAAESLNGTTVLHSMALMNGASLLRVHDVKEAVEAVKLFQAYAGK